MKYAQRVSGLILIRYTHSQAIEKPYCLRGRRDRMLVGFIPTYAISAYHH
jgi:hypothetical protein